MNIAVEDGGYSSNINIAMGEQEGGVPNPRFITEHIRPAKYVERSNGRVASARRGKTAQIDVETRPAIKVNITIRTHSSKSSQELNPYQRVGASPCEAF